MIKTLKSECLLNLLAELSKRLSRYWLISRSQISSLFSTWLCTCSTQQQHILKHPSQSYIYCHHEGVGLICAQKNMYSFRVACVVVC